MKLILDFIRDEQGQDLIEYTLLMSFVALVSAGIMLKTGAGISPIWSRGAIQLAAANTAS